MAHLLIRHRIEDFDAWKQAFDDFIETRRASGEKTWQIFRAQGDPNNIFVLNGWDTADNARAFTQKAELKEAMQKAGVAEEPEIYFLSEVDSGTV